MLFFSCIHAQMQGVAYTKGSLLCNFGLAILYHVQLGTSDPESRNVMHSWAKSQRSSGKLMHWGADKLLDFHGSARGFPQTTPIMLTLNTVTCSPYTMHSGSGTFVWQAAITTWGILQISHCVSSICWISWLQVYPEEPSCSSLKNLPESWGKLKFKGSMFKLQKTLYSHNEKAVLRATFRSLGHAQSISRSFRIQISDSQVASPALVALCERTNSRIGAMIEATHY